MSSINNLIECDFDSLDLDNIHFNLIDFEKRGDVSFLDHLICTANCKIDQDLLTQNEYEKVKNLIESVAKRSKDHQLPPLKKRKLTHISLDKPQTFYDRLMKTVCFFPMALVALVIEVVVDIFYIFVGLVYGFEDWNETKSNSLTKPNWLLIPGKASNHTTWSFVRTFFQKHANFFSYNLEKERIFSNDPEASILHYTKNLQEEIEKIKKQGEGKIRLLGHSMGGVIALALACQDPDVEEVVCIASPIFGAPIAFLERFTNIAKELRTSSPLLQKIREGFYERVLTGKVKITIIRGKMDPLVPPYYSTFPGAVVKQIELGSHCSTIPLSFPFLKEIFQRAQKEHREKFFHPL